MPPKKTLVSLCEKMQSERKCKIWTLSEDQNEYERFNRLLRGDHVQSLSVGGINAALRAQGIDQLSGETSITVVHDPSDIRKPYAREMEELESVRDLSGRIIPGYKTFNSVAISGEDKRLHLLGCVPKAYSEEDSGASEPGFRAQQMAQIRCCSQALRQANPQAVLTHVLDREYDDQAFFAFIDQELADRFVIRLKLNRISPGGEMVWDEARQKERPLKLKHAPLRHHFTQDYEKFSWGGRVYGKVQARFSYDMLTLAGGCYGLVRVALYQRNGKALFKEPMLLLSNFNLTQDERALLVFRTYLRRAKIEGVFKFLKEELGWEGFQVQDILAIQHIIVLCFFIGGYFYEIESELVHNEWMVEVCRLGGGKGKVTKRYFLRGIGKIANYLEIKLFMEENNLTDEDLREILGSQGGFT